MKRYVQFLEYNTVKWNNKKRRFENVPKYVVECTGSDGVFILDARNSINTSIQDSLERINKLKNINPDICGFRIMAGDFKQAKLLHEQFIEQGE